MNTESAVMLLLSGAVTLVGGTLLIVARFALARMDRGLGDLAEVKAAVLGNHGRGGLVADVADHETRIRGLEQENRE